jgi:hypothetical protein
MACACCFCTSVTSGVAGPDGDALANLRRGVGHGAHNGRMGRAVGQLFDGHPGQNRQQQILAAQMAANLRQHVRQRLRLDRQDDDLPVFGRFAVVFGDVDAVAVLQLFAPLPPGVGGQDLVGQHVFLPQQAANHRLAHDAAADK